MSDVLIYFLWLTALLVVRDELEHLWRAISCCRLNRSPQVSHSNGSFARSATVILLLTVPHCGIRLLCRFKSCGRLNIHTYIHTYIIIIIMRQDHQLPAQLGLHVVVSSSINKWQCHKYFTLQQRFQTRSMMTDHTYIHPCIHTYIHTSWS